MEINLYKSFIAFLIFILGGSFASFYDVFVSRREKDENFIFGRSHCDKCNRKLKFYEMIPVFSYILLRGRCKFCGERIGIEKFITEIFISILSVLIFFKFDLSLATFLIIAIITVATFIGMIDYNTGFIYNIDIFIILIFAILLKLADGENIFISLRFSLGFFIIFYLLYKFTGMMGLGDVFYSFVMGIFANNLLDAFILFRDAFVIAAIFSVILILLKKKNFKDSIAFGPFISIAIIIFLICRWIMFQKNTTKLILSDGFIKVYKNNKEEFDIISLPYKIYRDGKILDYHHFYYKFSKILEKVEFDKKDSLILIFDSSSFIHINYKIPEIDESEIKDFLALELEDYGDFDLSNYEIFYDFIKENKILNLSIDLVPRELIGKLREVLEKLEIENFEIIPEPQAIKKDGKYIEIAPTYLKYIFVKNNLLNSYEKIYDENFEKLIEENNLEEQNASNIINLRYDPEELKTDEDFLFRYKNYFLSHISEMEKFAKNEDVNLFGNICDSKVIKDALNSYSNLKFSFLENDIYNKISLKREKKEEKNIKKKNPINFILPIAIAAIIIFNVLYFLNLRKENDKKLESNKEIKTEEASEIDVSSDKFQERNKIFIDKISEIQKREDKNLIITNYYFDNGRMTVKGIVKDEDYFDKAFKDLYILSKNFYMENGFYKFEMQIK